MLTCMQASINVSEYNTVCDPPNRKTLAVNSSIAAEKTRDVSPDEIRCHVEENSRGSPTTHIGEPSAIPPPPVSQCYGLSSFNTEGPNTLETPPQSPGATSHAVSKSASGDHQVTSALTSQEPPKIKLFLQNTDGEVDFQNPLPSREFKDATLPEFFAQIKMLQDMLVKGRVDIVSVCLQIGEVVVEQVLLDLGLVSSYSDSEFPFL